MTETPSDGRRSSPDLGAGGVVALLTPAENPAAEPELSVLMPPDVNVLTNRMHVVHPDMLERLRAYEANIGDWMAPFGDAPLDAVMFACTGSTYMLGDHRRPPAPLTVASGARPVVCAADAIEQALHALQARRIRLVSPYPDALTEPAAAYWRRRGFELDLVLQSPVAQGGAHPIYAQTSTSLLQGLHQALSGADVDAVVVTGTGAPSLPAVAVAADETDIPILSSNLATAWATCRILSSDAAPLSSWLKSDAPWRDRLWSRFPAVRRNITAQSALSQSNRS